MLILSWLIVKKCRIIKRINNKICKRNAEIWCYQAVFAFLFCKDFWLCNVERMSYGVPRCTRGVDYRVFSVITIRKTRRFCESAAVVVSATFIIPFGARLNNYLRNVSFTKVKRERNDSCNICFLCSAL